MDVRSTRTCMLGVLLLVAVEYDVDRCLYGCDLCVRSVFVNVLRVRTGTGTGTRTVWLCDEIDDNDGDGSTLPDGSSKISGFASTRLIFALSCSYSTASSCRSKLRYVVR